MATSRLSQLITKLQAKGLEPVDPSALQLYRIGFGLLLAFGMLRFLAYGWVDQLYLTPKYHFHYWPLDALTPTPGPWVYGLIGVGTLSALMIAAGRAFKPSVITFLSCFIALELLDKTLYLNHYILVTWILVLLGFMPLQAGIRSAPRWCIWALRAQIATVYIHASLIKINPDWLLRGQPLQLWLNARSETPLIGSLFMWPQTSLAMSWAGMLYDMLIVPALLYKPTRKLAIVTVLGFHILTWLLFPIGIFPWVMILGTTIFFEPDWPKRLWRALGLDKRGGAAEAQALGERNHKWSRAAVVLWLGFVAFQALLPLRWALYPGKVSWHEQGYRFAWKVMLNEKTGDAVFYVRDPKSGQRRTILPSSLLTPLQEKMMSTQPDMILEFAHELAKRFEAERGYRPEVFAEVWVSWNGRRAAPLIDPKVDLAKVQDGLAPYDWVLPAPP